MKPILIALMPLTLALTATAVPRPTAANESDVLFWVFLNKGDNRQPLAKDEAERMQAAHVGNLGTLGKQGKALAAGPLGDNGFIRGIVVLTVKTPQEVTDCFHVDPFVQGGYLAVESYRWLADRKKIHPPDEPFKIAQYTLGIVEKGPNWQPVKEKVGARWLEDLIPALKRLSRSRDLAVSGPLRDGGNRIGILLFRTTDTEKIKADLDTDPAVSEGRVVVALHPQWLGAGVFGH